VSGWDVAATRGDVGWNWRSIDAIWANKVKMGRDPKISSAKQVRVTVEAAVSKPNSR
jgi:hypothetical protein